METVNLYNTPLNDVLEKELYFYLDFKDNYQVIIKSVHINSDPHELYEFINIDSMLTVSGTDGIFIRGSLHDANIIPIDIDENSVYVIGVSELQLYETCFTTKEAVRIIENLIKSGAIEDANDVTIIIGEELDWPPEAELEVL